jgi:hypothetical protein
MATAVASCGFYTMPNADFVVHVPDAARSDTVRDSVKQFALAHGLQAFDGGSGSPNEPAAVKALRVKTTYYLNPKSTSRGIGLTYLDATPGCKVIKLVEQSKEWTPASWAAIAELRAALERTDGIRVEMGNSPEDWRNTGRGLDAYCPLADG